MKLLPPEEDITTDPTRMLAEISTVLNARNDAALSRALEVTAPIISKIRKRRKPVGAPMLIRIHEVTGLSIAELRAFLTSSASQPSFGKGFPVRLAAATKGNQETACQGDF